MRKPFLSEGVITVIREGDTVLLVEVPMIGATPVFITQDRTRARMIYVTKFHRRGVIIVYSTPDPRFEWVWIAKKTPSNEDVTEALTYLIPEHRS